MSESKLSDEIEHLGSNSTPDEMARWAYEHCDDLYQALRAYESTYLAAIARVEALMDAGFGTPEGMELDILADLIEFYEARSTETESHGCPTPIGSYVHALEAGMEAQRRTIVELRARESDVVSKAVVEERQACGEYAMVAALDFDDAKAGRLTARKIYNAIRSRTSPLFTPSPPFDEAAERAAFEECKGPQYLAGEYLRTTTGNYCNQKIEDEWAAWLASARRRRA